MATHSSGASPSAAPVASSSTTKHPTALQPTRPSTPTGAARTHFRTDHTQAFRLLLDQHAVGDALNAGSSSSSSSSSTAFERRKLQAATPVVGRPWTEALLPPIPPPPSSSQSSHDAPAKTDPPQPPIPENQAGAVVVVLRGQTATREREESSPLLRIVQQSVEAARSARKEREVKRVEEWRKARRADREWIVEAEKVAHYIGSIEAFAFQIRRAYLSNSAASSLTAASPLARPSSNAADEAGGGGLAAMLLSGGGGAASATMALDDRQRDEVDYELKVMLKRSRDRIAELERGEQMRKSFAPSTTLATNPLFRLLQPTDAASAAMPARGHALYASQLGDHRRGVTSYLSARLASASSRAVALQERRLAQARERERMTRRSVVAAARGDGASGEGPRGGATATAAPSSSSASAVAGVKGGMRSSHGAGKAFGTAVDAEQRSAGYGYDDDEDGEDPLSRLDASQLQALEQESSSVLRSLQSELEAVRVAEQKVRDVAELQAQLVHHLSVQNETTMQLRDDADEQRGEVEGGNEQLRRARENSRSANRYLSAFLVGSGLTLLMLHWID